MEPNILQDLRLTIIVLGVFLGFSLGFFLLFKKSAKNNANRYLGILILTVTTFYLPHFFGRFGLLPYFSFVIGIPRILPFLFGPLVYLYVRACTQKGFTFRPILGLLFVPALLMFINCLPELLMETSEKIGNQARFAREGTVRDFWWIWLIKVLHTMIYFAISTRLVLLYRKHISNTTSAVDTAFHRWLLTFIFFLSIPISGLLLFVFGDFKTLPMVFLGAGLLIFLASIYFAYLAKPELFQTFPHLMPLPESKEVQKQRYENSTLTEVQKRQYLKSLTQYMDNQQPYTQSDLTLAQLSKKVKIPSHHLSQIINEKLGYNFLDFVNSYRVQAAQDKLLDPTLNHYTIVGIAYESGFNSKSTFYAAFKKVTGMTPSQYRKRSMVNV